MAPNKQENWILKNWKLLAWAVPLLVASGDQLIGKGLAGKAAQNAIQDAMRPIVEESVKGARADMDTVKLAVRDGFGKQEIRLSRIEQALIKLPGGKKVLRDIRREEQERKELLGDDPKVPFDPSKGIGYSIQHGIWGAQ